MKKILIITLLVITTVFLGYLLKGTVLAFVETYGGDIHSGGDIDFTDVNGPDYISGEVNTALGVITSGVITYETSLTTASIDDSESSNPTIFDDWSQNVSVDVSSEVIPSNGFYASIYSKFPTPDTFNPPRLQGGNINSCSLYVCKVSGNYTAGKNGGSNDVVIPDDSTYVFFVESGNLTIKSDVTLGTNSLIIFVVDGNIIIRGSAENINGIYIADGDIVSEGSDKLVAKGMFIAGGKIKLNRSGANPTEKFTFDPTLIPLIPDELRTIQTGLREEIVP